MARRHHGAIARQGGQKPLQDADPATRNDEAPRMG
jgi:hypothetical protein